LLLRKKAIGGVCAALKRCGLYPYNVPFLIGEE